VHGPYTDIFGDDPAGWEDASPVHHIEPDKGIPAYFVAARGPAGRMYEFSELIDGLRDADVPVTVFDAQALSHETVATNIEPGDTTIVPPLLDFLGTCFA
jgi:hypothetical protein